MAVEMIVMTLYYGIILSEIYSIVAGGKAHLVCSFIQGVFPCISS